MLCHNHFPGICLYFCLGDLIFHLYIVAMANYFQKKKNFLSPVWSFLGMSSSMLFQVAQRCKEFIA